jgi:hypothetical protein
MRKQITEKQASGMTLNERLYLTGLLGDFDKARNEGDVAKLRSILRKVYIPTEKIDPLIEGLFR